MKLSTSLQKRHVLTIDTATDDPITANLPAWENHVTRYIRTALILVLGCTPRERVNSVHLTANDCAIQEDVCKKAVVP